MEGDGTISKWQYKKKEGSGNYDSTWQDISNSGSTSLSHTFSGLTDGTNYQFKVRAKNATGTSADSAASDAATPAGRTLTAGSVTHNAATLTIGNYSGSSWYYKANAAPHASCSSAVSGTSTNLTSLKGNTSYTYKAYSDSSCTTANELASASAFLTKPGKPTKPVAASGAGSGKLTLTASVTGDGTLEQVAVCSRRKGANNFGTNWQDINSNSNSTSLSHTFTGLTDGTNYQFKVRAVNATGNGAASEASDAAATAGRDAYLRATSASTTATAHASTNYSGGWHYARYHNRILTLGVRRRSARLRLASGDLHGGS